MIESEDNPWDDPEYVRAFKVGRRARERVGEVLREREPTLTPDLKPTWGAAAQEWDARVDGPLVWAVGVNFGDDVCGASLRLSRDIEDPGVHRAVNELCEAVVASGAAVVPEGYVLTAHRRSRYGGGAGISLYRIEDVRSDVENEEEAVAYGVLLAVDLRALVTLVDALDLPVRFRRIVDEHGQGRD